MLLEGFVRSLGAPRHLLGNHVLLRADADGADRAAGADFQLMDGPDITTAHGLPFEWGYLGEDGTPRRGVPSNEELFVVEGPE